MLYLSRTQIDELGGGDGRGHAHLHLNVVQHLHDEDDEREKHAGDDAQVALGILGQGRSAQSPLVGRVRRSSSGRGRVNRPKAAVGVAKPQ